MNKKNVKRCPFCQEIIERDSAICPFCQENLAPDFPLVEKELAELFTWGRNNFQFPDIPDKESGMDDVKENENNDNSEIRPFVLKAMVLGFTFILIIGFYWGIQKYKKSHFIEQKILQAESAISNYQSYDMALNIINELLSKYPDNKEGKRLKEKIRNHYLEIASKKLANNSYNLAIYYLEKSQGIRYSYDISEQIEHIKQKKKIEEINKSWAAEGVSKKYINLFSDKFKIKVKSLGYVAKKLLSYDDFNGSNLIPKNGTTATYVNSYGFFIILENYNNGNKLFIKDHQLIIEEKEKGRAYWPSMQIWHRNFIVRFKLEYISGNTSSGAGFWFKADENFFKRFYFIIDAGGGGNYSIGYYDNNKGKWIDLQEWASSQLIKGYRSNIVELALINDHVISFINGEYLNTTYGIKNRVGKYCGFIVGTDHMRYAFDDFCMLALKKK